MARMIDPSNPGTGRPGLIANLRQLVVTMWRQARALHLPQTASSLTLLTLLAIVPMAAVGLLVLTAMPAFEPMRRQVERFLASNLFLPAFSDAVVAHVNEFVAQAGGLSAIGTVVFTASAITAMLTIDRTLNGIWRTPRLRPLTQRIALYWVMLTLGPVLLGVGLLIELRVSRWAPGTSLTGQLGPDLLPAGFAALLLTLIYRMLPNERVRWMHAVIGALAGALLLEGLKRLLGVYIERFPTFTLVYGAFAALPLFLVWLFSVWMAVLIGALLTANLRNWGVALGDPHTATPAGEFDRMARVLSELVRRAPERVESARFRADFDGDPRAADEFAALLAAEGYLVRVWPVGAGRDRIGVWDEYWLPAADLGQRTLRPLFDRVWAGPARRRDRWRAVEPPPPALDPGSPLLSRPLREVLVRPAVP